jgi:hypothetical protein
MVSGVSVVNLDSLMVFLPGRQSNRAARRPPGTGGILGVRARRINDREGVTVDASGLELQQYLFDLHG